VETVLKTPNPVGIVPSCKDPLFWIQVERWSMAW
jgi:hypothetical protein